jgi:hypothetical protein
MTLKANEPFTWTDPTNGEVYHFVAAEVEEFGNIFIITLPDGTKFDAFGQEINCPESVDITDEQVNPEVDDDAPIGFGALR